MNNFFAVCGGVLIFANGFLSFAQAAQPSAAPASKEAPPSALEQRTAELNRSLAALNKLLGQGDNGKSWRRFLLLDSVAAELAKGPAAADPAVIASSWTKLASKVNGLDRAPCVAAREAMGEWWAERMIPADETKLDAGQLEKLTTAGKQLFVDLGPAAVEHDRQALATATKALETYLSRAKAPLGLTATDLDLAQLKAQLAIKEPAADGKAADAKQPDLAVLKTIEDRFWAKQDFLAQKRGLEQPVYMNVGDALRQYRQTLAAHRLNNRQQALADDKAIVAADAARFKRYADNETRGPEMLKRLKFDELEKELAAPQPNVSALRAFAASFDAPLAEVEKVNAGRAKPLAAALNRYCDLAGAPPDYTRLRVDFEHALAGLGADLAKYRSSLATDEAAAVNARLAWLVDNDQAYPTRLALRRFEANPNFLVKMSQPLAAIGVSRRLNDPIAINENIMGTSIRGVGRTTGDFRLNFVPDDRVALFATKLRATTMSNTIGSSGPATIYATGATRLSGDVMIEMDARGVRWRKPSVNATTATRINGVATRSQLKLVQRIAERKVAEAKPQAELASSQQAAARARVRIEQELEKTIGKANQNYLDKFRNPLTLRRAFPQPLQMSTSRDWVSISAVQAQRAELAAIDAPPSVEPGTGMVVQVHESAINNWAEAMFAGATITKEQIDSLKIPGATDQPEQVDDCPEDPLPKPADEAKKPQEAAAPKSDEPPKPWKVVFADEKPITVSFHDEGFSIVIRVKSIESGENSAENKIIRAEYKIARRCDGVRLTRQSLTVTAMPGTLNESGRQTKIKNRMQELVFPETKVTGGLVLPGEWKKAGKLPMRYLKLAAGWASVSWDLPASQQSVADTRR